MFLYYKRFHNVSALLILKKYPEILIIRKKSRVHALRINYQSHYEILEIKHNATQIEVNYLLLFMIK